MVRVIEYEDGFIYFKCDKCDFWGGMDISSSLTDNCAMDVDIVCDLCGEDTVLYVLKCQDPTFAKELNAKLGTLRIKRLAEARNGD